MLKKYLRFGMAVLLAATFGGAAAAAPGDEAITKDVQAELKRHPDLKSDALMVQTVDGVVHIHGQVTGEKERRDIEEVVGKVRNVRKVIVDSNGPNN